MTNITCGQTRDDICPWQQLSIVSPFYKLVWATCHGLSSCVVTSFPLSQYTFPSCSPGGMTVRDMAEISYTCVSDSALASIQPISTPPIIYFTTTEATSASSSSSSSSIPSNDSSPRVNSTTASPPRDNPTSKPWFIIMIVLVCVVVVIMIIMLILLVRYKKMKLAFSEEESTAF